MGVGDTMYIQDLQAFHFKSYDFLEVAFHPHLNFLVGENGQGKTNVLDMLYYLSLCKSPQRFPDASLIQHDAPQAILRGSYVGTTQTASVAISIKSHAPKEVLYNDTPYERLADHIGRIPLVAVYPQDIDLALDGGDLKRRFMNATISQYAQDYLPTYQRYAQLLSQRNALLRGIPDETLLGALDEQLVSLGWQLYLQRKAFCEALSPLFHYYYTLLAQSEEQPDLCYESQLAEGDFLTQLREARMRDLRMGYTTVGIQRDSIAFSLGGYPLRREGSQGQQKTFVVALRLAQYRYLADQLHEAPLLLLDDIFDRFDASRAARLIELLNAEEFQQIFVTDTTTPDILRGLPSATYSLFHVEKSTLTLQP